MTPTIVRRDRQISSAQSRKASTGRFTGSGRSSDSAETTGTRWRAALTPSTSPCNRPTTLEPPPLTEAAAASRVNCRNVKVRRTVAGANVTQAARCSRPAAKTKSTPNKIDEFTVRLEKPPASIPPSASTAALPLCMGDPAYAWVPALETTTPAAAGPKASWNACRASRSAIGERHKLAWQTNKISNRSPDKIVTLQMCGYPGPGHDNGAPGSRKDAPR